MSATSIAEPAPRFADRTLAEIATSLPGATAVFRRRKLDFCCGGRVGLAEAAAAKGIALPDIEAELRAVVGEPAHTSLPGRTEELIDLIEMRYHAAHRHQLPELARLARRVEAVHRDNPAVPRGLADLLDRMTAELETHMRNEEENLFPMMRRGGDTTIAQSIGTMLAEHDDHGAHLRSLEALTTDFEPPAGACTTWRALYAGGRKFAEDLVEHIHIENNVLFPRFATRIA
ncbi:MAG TPA: iron-sulfur cluster repair di-iron protein [Acetobacteraceae bacterium]|nr:iron-sulfur cluster repair di-iron protein [Acetobacteraceae bacterium]